MICEAKVSVSEGVKSSSVISSTLAPFIDSAQLTNLVAKCYHLDLQRKLLEMCYLLCWFAFSSVWELWKMYIPIHSYDNKSWLKMCIILIKIAIIIKHAMRLS